MLGRGEEVKERHEAGSEGKCPSATQDWSPREWGNRPTRTLELRGAWKEKKKEKQFCINWLPQAVNWAGRALITGEKHPTECLIVALAIRHVYIEDKEERVNTRDSCSKGKIAEQTAGFIFFPFPLQRGFFFFFSAWPGPLASASWLWVGASSPFPN